MKQEEEVFVVVAGIRNTKTKWKFVNEKNMIWKNLLVGKHLTGKEARKRSYLVLVSKQTYLKADNTNYRLHRKVGVSNKETKSNEKWKRKGKSHVQ